MQVQTNRQIAEEGLNEFLEHEFGDYGFNWKIEKDSNYYGNEEPGDDEEQYFFEVLYDRYSSEDMKKSVSFKFIVDTKELYVNMYEDTYERVDFFDWTVKYFWMAILKWD